MWLLLSFCCCISNPINCSLRFSGLFPKSSSIPPFLCHSCEWISQKYKHDCPFSSLQRLVHTLADSSKSFVLSSFMSQSLPQPPRGPLLPLSFFPLFSLLQCSLPSLYKCTFLSFVLSATKPIPSLPAHLPRVHFQS